MSEKGLRPYFVHTAYLDIYNFVFLLVLITHFEMTIDAVFIYFIGDVIL
jgi:hypothetical protein